jgi:hypothetical protein
MRERRNEMWSTDILKVCGGRPPFILLCGMFEN